MVVGSRTPVGLMWLTVNRGCNFRCSWCYAAASGYSSADVMSLEMAMAHVEIAKQAGTRKVFIIGGEPTLWPHLFATADALRAAGIRTVLVSNAYRFADDSYWESYVEHRCDAVGASIKGFDAENLAASTGVSDFERCTKGLRRVCEFHKDTILSFVYARSCVGRLVDMVTYAKSCGAHGVSVNFCAPGVSHSGVDASSVVPVDVMLDEMVSSYDQVNEVTGGRVVYVIKHPLCLFPRSFIDQLIHRKQVSTTCHVQHRTGVIVQPNGQIALCNHMADFPVGAYGADYADATDLLEFYSSPAVQEFYDRANAYPSIKCTACSMYADCAGGCPILWTHHHPEELIPGWKD